MRKYIFYTLTAVLAALVIARSLLPEPAEYVMASPNSFGYNILNLDLPIVTETAGSGLLAEMNGYFLFRTPSAKNPRTGLLRGKNLILICADNWAPDPTQRRASPTLHRLWQEGAEFSQVYRPDWYQGMDGREFALLSGLMPTRVDDETALVHAGRQNIYLPFTLARCLGSEGYATFAFFRQEDHRDFYAAAGFSDLRVCRGTASESVRDTLPELTADTPFFAVYIFSDSDGEEALARLMAGLRESGVLQDTALCLLTGNQQPHSAQLFLWADGLSHAVCGDPCSELDVTPTLLNLFGIEFDSRFLSGRDVFSPNAPGRATDTSPLVSLYGSAYSDWVTDKGSYIAAENAFFPADDMLQGDRAVSSYVRDVCRLQYDRYIFARRAMEMDYFRLIFPENG